MAPEVLDRVRLPHHERPNVTPSPVFLVPVNYSCASQAALHLALLLAVPSKARLVVVRIIPAQRRTGPGSRRSGGTSSIERETERLQNFVDKFFSDATADAEHELVVAVDEAADRKIVELAIAHGAALIIMGASDDHLRERVFGSIVERTRRQATCPVVTIGARASARR